MHFRLLAIAILLGWCHAAFSDEHGREHVIPLFVPNDAPSTGAAGQQQGFLRIINHSNWAGTVQIYGFDDMGNMMGPATLSLDANQTQHVNSDDVENGNEGKGLSGGIGDGSGNWRLVLSSDEIDIEPLAYVRTKGDGLLISVHDIVSGEGMMHRVPIFNPGDNPNQRSSLRVINLGDGMANLTITGVDDGGAAGENTMTATVPANGATSISAADAEDMGLGDGAGKWSLMVMSDQPIQVMSLMDTPSGHLANLSAGRQEYRGATGLWQVTFEDGMGGDGFITLLPDSRLYAWLPETADTTRIARGVYSMESGMITGSGVVYESGDIPLDGLNIAGAPDNVTFSAMYRSGDWIRGSYEVAGDQPRNFTGYAYTGFERGGATQTIEGVWSPMGTNPDLPAELDLDVEGAFAGSIEVAAEAFGPEPLMCDFSGDLDALNAAFSVYEGKPVVDCALIAFGGETDPDQVELIMSVMDDPDMPGMVSRAVVFLIMPHDEKIALGALYER